MYDDKQLEKKLMQFFEVYSGYYELVSFEALKNFVRNYANESYRSGKEFGECDCDCPL